MPGTGRLRRVSNAATKTPAATPLATGRRKRAPAGVPLPQVHEGGNDQDELEPTEEELRASARKGSGSAEFRRSRPSLRTSQVAEPGVGQDELEANDAEHQFSSVPRPFRSAISVRQPNGTSPRSSIARRRLSVLQPPVQFPPPSASGRRRAPLAQMETPMMNALQPASRDSFLGIGSSARTAIMSVTPGMDKGKALGQLRRHDPQHEDVSHLAIVETPQTPIAVTRSLYTGQTPNGVPTRLIDPQLLTLAAARAQPLTEESDQSLVSLLPVNDASLVENNTELNIEDSALSNTGARSTTQPKSKNKGKGRAIEATGESADSQVIRRKHKRKSDQTGAEKGLEARSTKRRKSNALGAAHPREREAAESSHRTNPSSSARNATDQGRGRSRIPRSPVDRPPLASKSNNQILPAAASQRPVKPGRRQPSPVGSDEGPREKVFVPITVYRLSAPRPSQYISRPDDADDSDDDPLSSTAPHKSRIPGVNPVDVLNQIVSEFVSRYSDSLIKKHREFVNAPKAQRTQLKREAATIQAFQKHVSDLMFSLSTTLDANTELEMRVRTANKEKATLRNELMTLKTQREELALRMDHIRAKNISRRETFQSHQDVNSALFDIELAVKRGREHGQGAILTTEDCQISVETLASELKGFVAGEGAALSRIRDFNDGLEIKARTLEGRT